MEGHDADFVVHVIAVAVHHQGDVFKEARHVFKLAHGAHELFQVFKPPFSFRAFVVLPHFGVARFIQNHFGQIRVRKTLQPIPPAAETFNELAQGGARLVGLVGKSFFRGAIQRQATGPGKLEHALD
jgi:hypothetical protein